MLYVFFWVIPRHLNFICRRFGTLCLFHLHRQVRMKYDLSKSWKPLLRKLKERDSHLKHNSFTSPRHTPYLLHITPCGLHVGRYAPQPVSVLWTAPTWSPSFLSAQAIFEPNLSRINTPTFIKSSRNSYLPAYEDGTECSKTSAYKVQTPGKYPEESSTCRCHHGTAAIAKDYDKPNGSEILLKCASHYLGKTTLNNSLKNLEAYWLL